MEDELMAPLPMKQTGESGPTTDSHRSISTVFLTKTYQLVDDPSVDDLISWNEDGTGFIIWKPDEFARDLLPKYFEYNNFSSFVRQLNTYGFRKVVLDRWEFTNDYFRRGEKTLLQDIQGRKKSSSTAVVATSNTMTVAAVARVVSPTNSGDEQVSSSDSSPMVAHNTMQQTTRCTTVAELFEENEKLKKENVQLSQEVSELKELCSNILALMSDYASSHVESISSTIPEEKPLEELFEENKKLKKENVQLNQEVSELKELCSNILALMSDYASSHVESISSTIQEEKPLEEPY